MDTLTEQQWDDLARYVAGEETLFVSTATIHTWLKTDETLRAVVAHVKQNCEEEQIREDHAWKKLYDRIKYSEQQP